MSKSTMKTVTFQHLDTHPIGGSSLWLFGRQMDGKSVAVKVSGIKPHFVIKIDPDIEPSIWIEQLRKDVDLYRKSKSILFTENDDNIKMVKTIKPDDNLNTLLTYDVIDGQDITNYNEDGPCTFLRIKCRYILYSRYIPLPYIYLLIDILMISLWYSDIWYYTHGRAILFRS